MAIARKCGLLYGKEAQLISSVGTAGQLKQGHEYTPKSFSAAVLDTAKLSFWNLDNSLADNYGNVRSLISSGSPSGTGGIFGDPNGAMALVAASSQWLGNSSDDFFRPGTTTDYCLGGWFKANDWIPAATQTLFSNRVSGTDLGFFVYLKNDGNIHYEDASSGPVNEGLDYAHGFADGSSDWHHIAIRRVGTTLSLLIDGKKASEVILTARYRPTSVAFRIGGYYTAPAGQFFDGKVDEFFFINNVSVTDHDIAKLASTRIDHNAGIAFARQDWKFKHYVAGAGPATDLKSGEILLDGYDTNSAFVDFSWADATDRVDYLLTDARGG